MPLVNSRNCLANKHPHLAEQWDYARNGGRTPETVLGYGSDKHWWLCGRDHPSYEASVTNRAYGDRTGCPYCSGRLPIPGETDLATTHPLLCREWDMGLNGGLAPVQVKAGTGRKVWWRCSLDHPYEASPSKRTAAKPTGCPYCSGYKVLAGFNDLATVRPDVAAQWHPTKNGDLTPQQITAFNGAKVWWLCPLGHAYDIRVGDRTGKRPQNCPFCSGKRVLVGFNDLWTLHPAIASEWHPTKNGSLTPQHITAGSNKKVWWRCSLGHAYDTEPYNRVSGDDCPFCSGHRVMAGFNDLASRMPDLAAEWDFERNVLSPTEVTWASSKRVFWKCREGHSYPATVNNRSTKGSECSKCLRGHKVSKIGLRFVEALSERLGCQMTPEFDFPIAWVPSKPNRPMRMDGFVDAMGLRIAFEFDGPWHVGKEDVDQRKMMALFDSGMADVLVRVRYDHMPMLDGEDPRHLQFGYRLQTKVEPVVDKIVQRLSALASAQPSTVKPVSSHLSQAPPGGRSPRRCGPPLSESHHQQS